MSGVRQLVGQQVLVRLCSPSLHMTVVGVLERSPAASAGDMAWLVVCRERGTSVRFEDGAVLRASVAGQCIDVKV